MKWGWLKWAGLSCAVMGYFAPWLDPKPAALKLSGYDLVEWLTFTAGVRDGSLTVSRVDLLLPLICLSWLTALEVRQFKSARYVLIFSALLLAALVLPQYPFILTAHTDPELRPQLIAGLLALIGAPIFATLKIKLWPWAAVSGGSLAVSGLVCTWRAFALAQPAISEVFAGAVPLGWGIMLSSLGFIGYLIFGAAELYGKIRLTSRV